ncbi:hypothetical protein QFZ77_004873 [Paenibacillus sp. V4I3]|nr:hypothetical protein [Paenibacillus sp. V4I3]
MNLTMKYIIAAKVAVQKVAEDDCEIGFMTKQEAVPKVNCTPSSRQYKKLKILSGLGPKFHWTKAV